MGTLMDFIHLCLTVGMRWQSFGLQTHHCWWDLDCCRWLWYPYPVIRQASRKGTWENSFHLYFQPHLSSCHCSFLPCQGSVVFSEFSSHVAQFCSPLQRLSVSIVPLELSIYLSTPVPGPSGTDRWLPLACLTDMWLHLDRSIDCFHVQKMSLWVILSCFNDDGGSQTWLMKIFKVCRCEICDGSQTDGR